MTAQELSQVANSGLENVILRILSLQWKPLRLSRARIKKGIPNSLLWPKPVITCYSYDYSMVAPRMYLFRVEEVEYKRIHYGTKKPNTTDMQKAHVLNQILNFNPIFIFHSPSTNWVLQNCDVNIYFTWRSIKKCLYFSVQGSDGSRWAGSKEPGMMSAWLRSWSWLSSSSSSASFDGTWSVGGRDTGQGSMPLCSRIQFCLRVEGDRHRMAHRSWWW